MNISHGPTTPTFLVRGVPQQVADEVRRTRLSPGYGHPAHLELARGTGPCRCCLRPFVPGVDSRLLFTWRPPGRGDSLMAPGPVFIHAGHCESFAGEGFPPGLRELPLAFEARASGGRVSRVTLRGAVESTIEELFSDASSEWLHVRHAEAGCFIASVEKKGPAVSRGA